MRSRQKAVPSGKICHFFTFFWPFPEFQDPGIPEFRIPDSGILEFWNSGNGRFEGISVRVFSTLPLGKTYS